MAYNIRLVKLINGDMVLGKIDDAEGKIKGPASVQMMPTQQGGVQMAILPFGYPFDNEIEGEISTEHVIYEYKNVPDDLKNKYLEASSNLTISSANDLQNLQNLGGAGGPKGGSFSDLLKG